MSVEKIIVCDIPLCVSEITLGHVYGHEGETIFVAFTNIILNKTKWIETTIDEDGLLMVDVSEITSFFNLSDLFLVYVVENAGDACCEYEVTFTVEDGGEITSCRLQATFIKVSQEVEELTLKIKKVMGCKKCDAAEYVPLSRKITLNGEIVELREDGTYTIPGSAAWGAITGDIEDQEDLNNLVEAGDTAALNAAKTYADSLVIGLVDDRGGYDASANLFPATGGSGTAGAILKGDQWEVSVPGTLDGDIVDQGTLIRALVDTPGQTGASWYISNYNTQQATESTRGTARVVAQAELDTTTSTNDIDFITTAKYWVTAKTVLFTIAEFGIAVFAATIQAITLDNSMIQVGDTLAIMMGKLQGQINSINITALTVSGGLDGTLKPVQTQVGGSSPMDISLAQVRINTPLIIPRQGGGFATIEVSNDLTTIIINPA